jgi:hypothetical protein
VLLTEAWVQVCLLWQQLARLQEWVHGAAAMMSDDGHASYIETHDPWMRGMMA